MHIQDPLFLGFPSHLGGGFPGGSDSKESGCNPGDPERSPAEGNGYSLQYSCLENSMDRGDWWATVHGGCKESDMTE